MEFQLIHFNILSAYVTFTWSNELTSNIYDNLKSHILDQIISVM